MINNTNWQIGVGDPTFIGWLTVLIYLIATYKCFLMMRLEKKLGENWNIWLFLVIFLTFLGINKQLDLQTLFIYMARNLSVANGWYAYRKEMQLLFIILLGFILFLSLIMVRVVLVKFWRKYPLVWSGIFMLCIFILLRVIFFEHISNIPDQKIWGVQGSSLLEIVALLLVIYNAKYRDQPQYAETKVTKVLKNYIYIKEAGEAIACPQCAAVPDAKSLPGRLFKCKVCDYKYKVILKRES